MLYVLSFLLPPVVPLIAGKSGHFVLNIVLTFVGWIPGVVHALFVAQQYYKEQKQNDQPVAGPR